jgi:archaemetzincin
MSRLLGAAELFGLPVLAFGLALEFAPPNDIQRSSALGTLAHLPEPLQRALDPGDSFRPIPMPGPLDWLANHDEPGQTFDQFVRSHPNRPEGRRRKIYLVPLGDLQGGGGPPLETLRQFAAAFFGLEAAALPALDLNGARVRRRGNQMLTTDLLNLLQARLPDDAFALLGVTMADLYPDPQWNFVFGQASLRERVGVYSFARYDPRFYGKVAPDAPRIILRRSCRIVAHETGHMFGIQHCIWYQCLMNGSNHMDEFDSQPLDLCPVDLRKLQWSVGFDVRERYRRLLAFYTQAGFRDEADWLRARLRFIGGGS